MRAEMTQRFLPTNHSTFGHLSCKNNANMASKGLLLAFILYCIALSSAAYVYKYECDSSLKPALPATFDVSNILQEKTCCDAGFYLKSAFSAGIVLQEDTSCTAPNQKSTNTAARGTEQNFPVDTCIQLDGEYLAFFFFSQKPDHTACVKFSSFLQLRAVAHPLSKPRAYLLRIIQSYFICSQNGIFF